AHAVVHTHADAIVSVTNNDRPREVLEGVYGKDVIALDYRRPGFRISREVADAIAEHPEARALVLERHGTITWGARVRDAYEATMELITRAEEAIAAKKKGRRVFGGPRVAVLELAQRRAAALALAPRLRGRLGRDRRTAGIVDDIVHHTIDVIGNAAAFGRYVSLTAQDAYDVEYWPLELYKLTLAPPEKELARRIVLVTGGGSGIGRAAAKRLAVEGAH